MREGCMVLIDILVVGFEILLVLLGILLGVAHGRNHVQAARQWRSNFLITELMRNNGCYVAARGCCFPVRMTSVEMDCPWY